MPFHQGANDSSCYALYSFLLRRIRRGCFQCEPSCLDASWECVAGGVAPEDTAMQVTLLRGATIIIHCLHFFSIPSSDSLRLLLMRTVIPDVSLQV